MRFNYSNVILIIFTCRDEIETAWTEDISLEQGTTSYGMDYVAVIKIYLTITYVVLILKLLLAIKANPRIILV